MPVRTSPRFHHQQDSIEAHLTIVFVALAITRDLQSRTGFSIRRVVHELEPLRNLTVNATRGDPRKPQPSRAAISGTLI